MRLRHSDSIMTRTTKQAKIALNSDFISYEITRWEQDSNVFRMVANAINHFLGRNLADTDPMNGDEQREPIQLLIDPQHFVYLRGNNY